MQRSARFLLGIMVLAAMGLGAPTAGAALVEPPQVQVADSDGDGIAEASASGIAGGPCACRCPIMGAGSEVAALGQAVTFDTRSALVVCGTRLAAGANPNGLDAGGGPHLTGRLRLNPNGLGRGGPAG